MRKYPWKTRPYKHQREALRKALELAQCALLMEPRTGKTKVAIDYLSALALAGRLDRAVIVAPARVLDVWVEEFHRHCPVNYSLHIWDKDARTRKLTTPGKTALVRKDGVTSRVSTRSSKQRVMNPLPRVHSAHDLTVVLINYEAFAHSGRKIPSGRSKTTGRFAVRKQIERWLEGAPAAMILDESHKIKSPSGKAATMIVSMRPFFKYRLILTGTPITKASRVFDVYMQWKFLNPDRFAEWPTQEDFQNQFGVWRQMNGYRQFKRAKNLEQLQKLIREDSFRVTREECFDLPDRTTRIIPIELSAKSGQAYDELAKEMVAEIEHGERTHLVEASIALVLTLRLTQITGGYVSTPDKQSIPVGTEKLDALAGFIDEAIENDEKVVVAARFRAEMDAIAKMIRDKGVPVFEVRGGLSRGEVTSNIKKFKETQGVGVVVMNPQAGGVGIDLSTASHMVWYSLTPSWVNYTQACDRIALSKQATTYTYLLAKDTVDYLLYNVLQEDGNVSETILANPRKVLRS